MSRDTPDMKLEQQIDAYIKGHLTEKEAQKLWRKLLKHPEYIDRLETEIDVARYHRQVKPKNRIWTYRRWIMAAAAIILIVVGINVFSSQTSKRYTIESISLFDDLATSETVRSDKSDFKEAGALLNLAFSKAVNGNTDEARSIYSEIINNHPGTVYAAKAHLNIGIIAYNKGNFETSIDNFNKTLSINISDNYLNEQAFWYSANALINAGKVEEARQALQNTSHLNGI